MQFQGNENIDIEFNVICFFVKKATKYFIINETTKTADNSKNLKRCTQLSAKFLCTSYVHIYLKCKY